MIIQHRRKGGQHNFIIQGSSSAEEMMLLIRQFMQLMKPAPGKTIGLHLDCSEFDGIGNGQADFQIRVDLESGGS
jgi:hypothetical protein